MNVRIAHVQDQGVFSVYMSIGDLSKAIYCTYHPSAVNYSQYNGPWIW